MLDPKMCERGHEQYEVFKSSDKSRGKLVQYDYRRLNGELISPKSNATKSWTNSSRNSARNSASISTRARLNRNRRLPSPYLAATRSPHPRVHNPNLYRNYFN